MTADDHERQVRDLAAAIATEREAPRAAGGGAARAPCPGGGAGWPAAFQVFEANTGPAQVVNLLGTEEQRERFLPGIIAGENSMAVAISEPDAGSAATDLTTNATYSGGTFRLNGTKRWISNGGEADHYLVYVRLDG